MLAAMNMAMQTAQTARTSPAVPHARPSRAATGAAGASPLRLLLVDDSRVNRMAVTSALVRWGIVPTMACNGEQAVKLAERCEFDFVLMDILMPVMDGVVATARIRQFERENPTRAAVPIVAYTSLDLGPDTAHLARVGLSAVLPKPCSATALLSCLAFWCPHRFVSN